MLLETFLAASSRMDIRISGYPSTKTPGYPPHLGRPEYFHRRLFESLYAYGWRSEHRQNMDRRCEHSTPKEQRNRSVLFSTNSECNRRLIRRLGHANQVYQHQVLKAQLLHYRLVHESNRNFVRRSLRNVQSDRHTKTVDDGPLDSQVPSLLHVR